MKSKEYCALFLCALVSILPSPAAASALAPYATHSGFYPGGVFDIGTVSSAAAVRVVADWQVIAPFNAGTKIQFHKIASSGFTQVNLISPQFTIPT